MSGIEDISDDDNEDVEAVLSSKDQPNTTENKPTIDTNDVSGSEPADTSSTRDETGVDVADREKSNNDGEVVDISKAGSSNSAPKVIAMSPCPIQPPELPEGWISIQHASGATVYFHRESRVCSWGMPYVIKKGTTVKKHPVPVWSIPCLQEWLFKDPEADHVKRWKELEHKKTTPLARISPELVEEYLCQRWQLKSVTTTDEEKSTTSYVTPPKKRKIDPSCLPTTLSHIVKVKIPDHLRKSALQLGCKSVPKEWTVNTGTKSAAQILLEFVHLCPIGILEYKFSECRDVTAPYVCTTLINNISYGQASAITKKQAKQLAAEKTLDILLPNTFTMFKKKRASTDDYQYFAGVSIEDPRLAVMCDKAGLPQPYSILTECVQRHQGILPDTEIVFSVKSDEANNLQYHMSLGKTHKVTGSCTNKKEGKQLASQALIKELHPFVNDWGTIMNMYANTWKNFDSKQKIVPEHESPKTQEEKSNASSLPAADQAILKKLHNEMRKLSKASSEAPTDFRERHLLITKNTVPSSDHKS